MTRRFLAIAVWSAGLLAIASCRASDSRTSASAGSVDVAVLRSSTDRKQLVASAVALAHSTAPEALVHLRQFLGNQEFLARLDSLDDPHTKTRHLGQVLGQLAQRPPTGITSLCLDLAADSVFLSDSDRLRLLLPVLAADTPMTEAAVALFMRTNTEGYFAFNAPLLARNASPRALELFVSMMNDSTVEVDRRIDCIHTAVLPNRTRLPVLQAARRLIEGAADDAIRVAVIESIFDERGKEWFGPAMDAPRPPEWSSAPEDVLRYVLLLSSLAEVNEELPGLDHTPVVQTVDTIEKILDASR